MANEKRLIDVEQAKRATYEEIFWTESEQAVVRNFLAKIPKVDAVEVVRCKECQYGELDDVIYRKTIDGETNDTTLYCCFYRWDHNERNKGEHFCSYGERRTDEA